MTPAEPFGHININIHNEAHVTAHQCLIYKNLIIWWAWINLHRSNDVGLLLVEVGETIYLYVHIDYIYLYRYLYISSGVYIIIQLCGRWRHQRKNLVG